MSRRSFETVKWPASEGQPKDELRRANATLTVEHMGEVLIFTVIARSVRLAPRRLADLVWGQPCRLRGETCSIQHAASPTGSDPHARLRVG